MQYQEFNTADRNQQGNLFFREWLPDAEPEYLICLVHGQSEHSGRYQHVADFFIKHGIGVLAIDLLGHGKTYGRRGHALSVQDYLDNVWILIEEAKARHPAIPKVIYGHSMGGNVVANYALSKDFDTTLKGVILSSPWFKLAFEPPAFKELLGSIMKSIYPAYTEDNELTGEGLSRDPEVGPAYVNDPLVHGKITAGAYFACKQSGLHALENAQRFPKPSLVLHGTADPIISHEASSEFAQKAGEGTTHIEFDGGLHELHNDIVQNEVLETILKWIKNIQIS